MDSPAKKKNRARVVTAVFIACVLALFYFGRGGKLPRAPAEQDSPDAAVWRVMDGLRGGDPDFYLSCYTGELESQLRRSLQDMGPARFREYLSNMHRQIKGIAVSAAAVNGAGEARVPVEYVYADRNERQQFYLRQVSGKWKVFRMESSARVPTLIPFGTPVSE